MDNISNTINNDNADNADNIDTFTVIKTMFIVSISTLKTVINILILVSLYYIFKYIDTVSSVLLFSIPLFVFNVKYVSNNLGFYMNSWYANLLKAGIVKN